MSSEKVSKKVIKKVVKKVVKKPEPKKVVKQVPFPFVEGNKQRLLYKDAKHPNDAFYSIRYTSKDGGVCDRGEIRRFAQKISDDLHKEGVNSKYFIVAMNFGGLWRAGKPASVGQPVILWSEQDSDVYEYGSPKEFDITFSLPLPKKQVLKKLIK